MILLFLIFSQNETQSKKSREQFPEYFAIETGVQTLPMNYFLTKSHQVLSSELSPQKKEFKHVLERKRAEYHQSFYRTYRRVCR